MNQVELKINVDVSNPNELSALTELLQVIGKRDSAPTSEEIKKIPVVEPKEVKASKPAKETKKAVSKPEPVIEEEIEEESETEETVEEETTDEGPTITLDDIRPLLQKKVANNRDAIKDKLEEFGAKNATSLDENYYVEFHEFLEGLK